MQERPIDVQAAVGKTRLSGICVFDVDRTITCGKNMCDQKSPKCAMVETKECLDMAYSHDHTMMFGKDVNAFVKQHCDTSQA